MKFRNTMILPALSLALIILGTIIGAYLTYNYRKETIAKQAKIEKLNSDLQESVSNNLKLSNNIIKISTENNDISKQTADLVEKNKLITERVNSLLIKTENIVRENRSIVMKNGQLTDNVSRIAKKIDDFQTGGESFPSYSIFPSSNHKPYFVRVGITIKGNDPLYIQSHSLSNNTLYEELADSKVIPPIVTKDFFEQHMKEQQDIAVTMPYLEPGVYIAGLINFRLAEMYLDPRFDSYVISIITLARNGQFETEIYVEKGLPEGAWLGFQYIITKSDPNDETRKETILDIQGDYFKDINN